MLKKAFGLTIEYTEWEKQKLLPLYISSNYRFYNALIDGFRFIVIEAIGNDATLPALKKHIKKIYEVDSAPVAVYCSWISSLSSSWHQAISGSIIQNSIRCRRVLDFSARKVGPIV